MPSWKMVSPRYAKVGLFACWYKPTMPHLSGLNISHDMVLPPVSGTSNCIRCHAGSRFATSESSVLAVNLCHPPLMPYTTGVLLPLPDSVAFTRSWMLTPSGTNAVVPSASTNDVTTASLLPVLYDWSPYTRAVLGDAHAGLL